MNDSLKKACENFIENRDKIKAGFGWEFSYMYPVCAAIFTNKRQSVSIERMKECRSLLKEKQGIFSNFRGMIQLVVISMLAADDAPERRLDNALVVHAELREHFFRSLYLPVVSLVVADIAEPGSYQDIAARTKRIYKLMRSEHPLLTSEEDSVYAALLALSERSDEDIVGEAEACYERLKGEFMSRNAVQSLSHALALGEGTAEEKCERTMELYKKLREAGRKYGTGYELATLGVAALIPGDLDTITEDILAADEFLSHQKGYGLFGSGKHQRLMHAAMLVCGDRIGGSDVLDAAAINGAVALVVAQQIGVCAAVAASGAAVHAASNS